MASKKQSSAKILPDAGITFDDVLLLPGYTDFSRKQVDLSVSLHPTIVLKMPVISSPMDTVTETEMATMMAMHGGLGIVHRNLSVDAQTKIVRDVKGVSVTNPSESSCDVEGNFLVGAAVGVGEDFEERVQKLINADVDLLCIDSGHGNTAIQIDAIKRIKELSPRLPVMAGNVASAEGARNLVKAGADIIRVGMGPGSICTTRIITGMGVPQLTAVMEAVKGVEGTHATVIADGGIRQMGDIAKALAAGASAVMLGSMLAGFEQSPGETVELNGQVFKKYRGMGSLGAMKKGGAERYGQSVQTADKKLIAEGVEGLVPFKGSGQDFLMQVAGSLKSSFYYIGGRTLSEFQERAQFIKITPAGLKESHAHTLSTVLNAGANYFL
jgi:IMP dehydrogenase